MNEKPDPVELSDQNTPNPTSPKPSSKKKLLAAVAAIFLVLTAGGSATYAFWYQNPDKAVGDALYSLLTTSSLQSNTVITSDSELASGFINIKLKKLTFDTSAESSPTGEAATQATIELNGREYTAGAKVRLTDSRTLFFRIDDVKATIKQAIEDFGGETQLSSEIESRLDAIQNKWVKVTTADMGEQADTFTCIVDTSKRIANDPAHKQEAVDLYKNNQFLTVKEKVGTKDGALGYRIEVDTDALKAYAKANENSQAVKELNKCTEDTNSSAIDEDSLSEIENTTKPKVDLVLWVSRFGHKLQQVDYTITANNPSTTREIKFEGATKLSYDNVKIEAPSESVTLDEWRRSVEDLSESIGSYMSGPAFMSDDSIVLSGDNGSMQVVDGGIDAI